MGRTGQISSGLAVVALIALATVASGPLAAGPSADRPYWSDRPGPDGFHPSATAALTIQPDASPDESAGPTGPRRVPLGAFLGSGADGVAAVDDFEAWLGAPVMVGHTYLPGSRWSDIEGEDWVLGPWTRWHQARPGRRLVLNVPMVVPNEPALGPSASANLLRRGAAGEFDGHFRILAGRLVGRGAGDTIIVPGWELNGTTYTSRCGSDPAAWMAYWRRIVAAMRSVPGQHFRFDFNAVRGPHEVSWADCYPGDDVVDIIGMDTYDQRPGRTFDDFENQRDGLRDHVEFAVAHSKPISFPEWGLYDYGDNPAYVEAMHDWIMANRTIVAYQTITDYCPHGVWQCDDRNPRSSAAYRALFGTRS